MSSNDDSPTPQHHSAEPDFPSASSKNSEIDTVDALLRIIFRLNWKDWVLIATIVLCLSLHYISITHNCSPLVVDIIKIITVLISAFFIFRKISNAYKSKESIISFFKIHPIQLFVSIIACGATVAFFLPLILNIFKLIGDTDKLTTALLALTGGIIAVFTLIKTHQKNQNDEMSLQLDREKYEQQKEDRSKDIEMQNSQMQEQKRQFNKKIKQEAYRSRQERTRQIHAERRSRYTKAAEQLAHENASIRLGGVFTLFGLADEWIADESLEPQKRQKEGQTIINYLCAYIRSVPAKQTEASFKTGSYPQDEAEIRQTIFMEMSSRFIENKKKVDKKSHITQKSWNNFIFNFNNSHIFYPLNDLVFFNADFQGVKFYRDADLSDSRFYQETQFTKSKFFSCYPFKGTEFYGNTYFNKSQFNPPGGFTQKIGEVFEKLSSSGPVNQHDNHPTEGYTFFRSVFYEVASFQKAHFYTNESISQSSFNKDVDFQESIFDGTRAFIETSFSEKPNFKGTLFAYLIPDIFNNSISQDGKKLNNGIATLLQDNKMFLSRKELPVGARLFDPNSWNSTDKKYDRVSHPAL